MNCYALIIKTFFCFAHLFPYTIKKTKETHMKILIILLFINGHLLSMEDKPHYHINNKIVYLKKESSEQEFTTVSDFNKTIERQQQIMAEAHSTPKAYINTGMSNRFKVIAAAIVGGSTIAAAIISALVTYYSKKC